MRGKFQFLHKIRQTLEINVVNIGAKQINYYHKILEIYSLQNIYFLCLGTFTPVTIHGNMVVDGILASWYAVSDHDSAHLVMALIRWFPKMTAWIFGESDGSPAFVNNVEYLGKLGAPYGQLYERTHSFTARKM